MHMMPEVLKFSLPLPVWMGFSHIPALLSRDGIDSTLPPEHKVDRVQREKLASP